MILFDSSEIDKLNKAFSQVSPNMFFAAYYLPKPEQKGEAALNLRIAVTNGYGLFIDCSNYLVTWASRLESKQILTRQDQRNIRQFIQPFKDFRSLFCHNQTEGISSVKKQVCNARKFLEDLGINCNKYENMQPFLTIEGSSQYETIISTLNDRAKIILNIFNQLIHKYDTLKKEQKAIVLDSWCEAVADWYYGSANFRFQAKSDIFKLWRQSDGYDRRGWYSGNSSERFKNWTNHVELGWKQSRQNILAEIQENIRNSQVPAYPIPILFEIIQRRYGGNI